MASKIQDVWGRYIPVFAAGHDGTVNRATPIYAAETGNQKLGDVPKDADVHYVAKRLNTPPSRMEVCWYPNGRAQDFIQGWISISAVKKPQATTSGVRVSMKPQDFPGIGGTRMRYSAYLAKIRDVVRNRDIPIPLKNYLIQLIDYCDSHSGADRTDLLDAYQLFASSSAFDSLNNIQKDFSELIAPICVLEHGHRSLEAMGFADLDKSNATVFVPTEGNYPLVDFIIYDDSGREYPFSVKVMSSTTNVIKPQDLMTFVNDNPNDPFMMQFKRTTEYEVLRRLGDESKGVAQTQYETIRYLAQTQPYSSELPANLSSLIPETPTPENFPDATIDANMATWNSMYDRWIRGNPRFLNEANLTTGRLGKYNQLSYLMAVAITKISQDRTNGLNYLELVRDFLMAQVSYYKFRIQANGLPEFKMENKFHNDFTNDTKFVLRTKASKGSPLNDRIGVQP